MSLEIITDQDVQRDPVEESVDWAFYMQFPKDPLPLDLFVGSDE